MLKVIAAFDRKPGWSRDEFLCHYRERHAALVAGTASFTRHCGRYEQHWALTPLPGLDRNISRDAVSAMWFDDLAAMEACYAAPDYLERARPDEQRFADFAGASVLACNERQVQSFMPAADPDRRWTRLPLFRLFLFHDRPGTESPASWGERQERWIETWQRNTAFASLVREYVISLKLADAAADLPTQAGDATGAIEELSFTSRAEAEAFVGAVLSGSGACRARLANARTLFAKAHTVFTDY